MSTTLWRREAILSEVLLWNPLARLRGSSQTIDWWRNGERFNASSTATPDAKTSSLVSTNENMNTDWNHKGGEKKRNTYMVPFWTVPPNLFSHGGNTIFWVLALQKEIGLGSGWKKWKLMEQLGVRRFVCGPTGALMWLTPIRTSLFISAAALKPVRISQRGTLFSSCEIRYLDEEDGGGCFWWADGGGIFQK